VQILTQEGIQAALNPTQEATQPAQIPSWDGSAPALSDAEGKRGVGSFLSPDDTQDQRKPDLGITDRSVQPEQYGRFLIEIFDEWVRRDVGKTYVLFFDGVLASYVNGRSSVCVLQPTCGEGVALEHNGDVYSCDHFVEPKHLLGNITTTPLGSLVSTVKQLRFGLAKSTGLPQTCRECRFLFTCHGECPKNRVLMTPDGEPGLNWLCAGLKAFFEHTEKPMKEMARLLKSGHYADEIMKPLREST
jgi:uncharacterized protein